MRGMGEIQLTAAMPNKALERDAAKNEVPPSLVVRRY